MKVVVGLGNPGPQYAKTRHNVGFMVIGELARRHSAGSPRVAFEAETAEIHLGGEKVLLLSPLTYMNLSGRSVRAAIDFYKLELSDVLVVCDDFNLDCGRLRMRRSGSSGGQKGLADIIRKLGSEEFARLRIGIGRPPGQMDATNYVLGKFRPTELESIDVAVVLAADGVESWIRDGISTAMNRVNASPAAGDDKSNEKQDD
jgi:PTH1 family peptidyl-tRNA hydrolase